MAIRGRDGRSSGRRAVVAWALFGVLAFPFAAAGQTASREPVTFTKDIAPILQRSCQRCHRPDSLAPMSLIDYEEVRPWARSIKQRTALRDKPGAMPPWYVEKDIGIQQFKNDPSLSDAEIAKLAAWADNGAPRGDPADMPPPVAFIDVDEWEIGQPDLIVSSPSVEVPAEAPDWWGPHGETPSGLTEDRYVAALEFKEVTESRTGAARDTVGRAVRDPPRRAGRGRSERGEGRPGAPAARRLADPRGGAQRRRLRSRGGPADAGGRDRRLSERPSALQRRRHAGPPGRRLQVPPAGLPADGAGAGHQLGERRSRPRAAGIPTRR